jgi:hypothetical protein
VRRSAGLKRSTFHNNFRENQSNLHVDTVDLVKNVNGDLLADSHNILNRWKNYSQLLDVHKMSDVRQIEIRTAEPLVPDPSSF